MATNKFFKAVLITGLIAGTLDATAASIQFMIKSDGDNPAKVFRYVASAAFGPEAKTKDLYTMAAWGLLFHYLIAMSFTLFFFLCFRQIRMVLKNKFVAGIVYGIFAWCVMNLLVVPLAFGIDFSVQYQKYLDNIKNSLIAMGILIIAIGLPISLLADRFYSKK
jgi:hypothetical protein